MAGYVFSLNNMESLHECIHKGVYGTILTNPKNNTWGIHHEATFADYASMKAGDYVFFFIKRKIYGIGKLKNLNIDDGLDDCKFLNYPNADKPIEPIVCENNIFLDKEDIQQRFICTFEPYPDFFKNGIDMDDALSSKPECFKMLRAFWKVSFIKLDDDEATCLFDVLLKKSHAISDTYPRNYLQVHDTITAKLNNDFLLTSKNILRYASNGNSLKHEMALEAGIIDQLSRGVENTIATFGNQNYISHQVVASPFKAIDYMDKIDIFMYSCVQGFSTKDKYSVLELKKDKAKKEDIDQLLKYVDWIKDEYAGQDYSSINAYLVAYDFEDDIQDYMSNYGTRYFSIGRRPVITDIWSNITLVKYRFDELTGELFFTNETLPS